ncbi:MAG: hypothetical protein WAO61_09020 [Solirubrobacterales bacterium]
MYRSAILVRPRTGRLTLLIFAALVAALFAATGASAAQTVDGVTYYTTADLCSLTVSPKTATRESGQTHTVSATLAGTGAVPLAKGNPRDADITLTGYDVFRGCVLNEITAFEGADVRFTVTSGPNAGQTAVAPLNAAGVATFSYTGAGTGTDSISATIELPDICYAIGQLGLEPNATDVIPPVCAPPPPPEIDSITTTAVDCEPVLTAAAQSDCPSVVLNDSGSVTWTAPQVVVRAGDPSVSLSRFKRCVSRKFKISPTYTGGQVKTSTLFIDSRKVATRVGSTAPFTVNPRRYKAGKHNVEVVTVFTSGKAASKFGSFSRCKARAAQRKVSPRFTG